MPNTTTTTERDSDYFRRIGGYQGPVKLTALDVGCPTCESTPGQPCRGAKGPIKRTHAERGEFRDELLARANVDGTTARWYRHEFREGRIPAPPKPHGTFAAYQRHKRSGVAACEPCKEAARAHWRAAKQARAESK